MLQGCSLWAMGDRSGIAASRPFSSQPGAKCVFIGQVQNVSQNTLWLFHICHITVRCQICETKTIIYKRATLYFNLFCSFQLLNLAVGGSVKGPVDQVCIKPKYTTPYMGGSVWKSESKYWPLQKSFFYRQLSTLDWGKCITAILGQKLLWLKYRHVGCPHRRNGILWWV